MTIKSSLILLILYSPIASIAASNPPEATPDLSLDHYAQAAQLVDIDSGRKLNLRCSGSGNPAVILEAGFGADSMTWLRLQPLIAEHTRVCSYDRAGYGFSDLGPMPRDTEAEVSDLHALIHTAQIALPAIFVGHSLGTNIVRRYDQIYPQDVAGLVLLDPPEQNIAAFSPAYQQSEIETLPLLLSAYRECEQGARDLKLTAPPAELQNCLRGPNPLYSDKLNAAIRSYKSSLAFWQTIISGAESKANLFDQPVSPDEQHTDKPLVVMTALNAYGDVETDDRQALEAAQHQTHEALVQSSNLGKRIMIEESSHDIQFDRPDAVLNVILEILESE